MKRWEWSLNTDLSSCKECRGTKGGYWARAGRDGEVIQHSFWLFETEEGARAAETTFNTLRDMPGAPAVFVSVDVCEVIGQAPAT